MIHMDIGLHGKGRIWFNEDLSDLDFVASRVLKRQVEARTGIEMRSKRIAVEILLPRGGRAEYGLLGLNFSPDDRKFLVIKVACCKSPGSKYHNALAGKLDDTRVGLPEEYALAVSDAASTAAQGLIPSGEIFFNQAAHGLIGSNRHLFAKLTTLIIRLTVAPLEQAKQIVLEEFETRI